MSPLAYTLVIATHGRPAGLAATLNGIALQSRPPASIVVVDTSPDERSRDAVSAFESRLPISYRRGSEASAAMQRNEGALGVTTPLIGFLDDDIVFAPDAVELICSAFESDSAGQIGGIAARIRGRAHPIPSGLLWGYYRLQAGYSHPTYGGKLFGAAINCLPCYSANEGMLIPSDWLNSACVFYRTPLFAREKFPQFHGYSFMEDVHLSARIARTHRLFFHATAFCDHLDTPGTWKRDMRSIARMRVRNQRLVAREVMGLSGPILVCKLLLHRLFASVSIARRREQGWIGELIGTWTG